VTQQGHACFGATGIVLGHEFLNQLEVRLDEEVNGKRRGLLKRSHVSRLGYARRGGGNTQSAVRMDLAREQFMIEARNEIRRIERVMMNNNPDIRRIDVDGNDIIVGDLVYVLDHPMTGWVCKIVAMNELGPIELEPSMPPQVLRRPSRIDLENRRNRPVNIEVNADNVRLMVNVRFNDE